MRVFESLSAISLALAVADPAAAQAPPRRVASLNLCTDELLLTLAAPAQIISVTRLAHDSAETPLWAQARRYRRNDGSLLSVAGMRPDLLITMGGSARDRARIASRLRIRTLDLPFPQGLDDVEEIIRQVAGAVGRPAAGARLLGELQRLRSSAPPAGLDAMWLGGGGRTAQPGGLAAQWMALAGLRQRGLRGDRVSLETLLTRPPRILLRSDYRPGQYSLEQRWLTHPLARRVRGARTIATDGRRWTCMGPLMIGETYRIRRELAQ